MLRIIRLIQLRPQRTFSTASQTLSAVHTPIENFITTHITIIPLIYVVGIPVSYIGFYAAFRIKG
jgi:hypothetical protein